MPLAWRLSKCTPGLHFLWSGSSLFRASCPFLGGAQMLSPPGALLELSGFRRPWNCRASLLTATFAHFRASAPASLAERGAGPRSPRRRICRGKCRVDPQEISPRPSRTRVLLPALPFPFPTPLAPFPSSLFLPPGDWPATTTFSPSSVHATSTNGSHVQADRRKRDRQLLKKSLVLHCSAISRISLLSSIQRKRDQPSCNQNLATDRDWP